MLAKLNVTEGVSIVSIQGPLGIEKTQEFREICLRNLVGQKVIFNMQSATIVGSTGLQAFFDTVKTLSEEGKFGLKLVGLSPEFKRIFINMGIQNLTIHESLDGAVVSFKTSSPDII